jgi:hypothetical protein
MLSKMPTEGIETNCLPLPEDFTVGEQKEAEVTTSNYISTMDQPGPKEIILQVTQVTQIVNTQK